MQRDEGNGRASVEGIEDSGVGLEEALGKFDKVT